MNKRLIVISSLMFFFLSVSAFAETDKVEELIKRLNNENSVSRKEASEALGALRDPRAVWPLINMLKDEDENVSSAAATALLNIGQSAVEPLITVFGDKDLIVAPSPSSISDLSDSKAISEAIEKGLKVTNVRLYIIEILGRLKDPRAVEPLIRHLDDTDLDRDIAKVLGWIGDRRAVLPLINVVKDKNRSPSTRLEAARSLVKGLNDKSVIPILVLSLQDWRVNEKIADLLGADLGWQPQSTEEKVHFLIGKKDGKALVENWDETKQVLFKDLKSYDRITVENALFTLIRLGKSEVIEELIDILNSGENSLIAEVYLNCSNKRLNDAALAWAKKNGYTVSASGGFERYGAAWGSWK